MNDDIEKINQQNRDLSKPSDGNFSQAGKSSITTNEEDSKKSMAENIILDLGNQRQEIDAIKEMFKKMLDTQQVIGTQVNTLTQALQQIVHGTPQNPASGIPQQGFNMENISIIGDLLEKGAQAWKTLKGNDNLVVDEFTKTITENAKAEAIESLNIVHLINKKVKGKLVQDIAGDIAGNVINDSDKQNSHDPQ